MEDPGAVGGRRGPPQSRAVRVCSVPVQVRTADAGEEAGAVGAADAGDVVIPLAGVDAAGLVQRAQGRGEAVLAVDAVDVVDADHAVSDGATVVDVPERRGAGQGVEL